MSPFALLEKLESLSGRLQKQALLSSYAPDHLFIQLLLRGYDRERLYGLKNVKPQIQVASIDESEYATALIDVLDRCSGGDLSAADFKRQIGALAQKATPVALKWTNCIIKHRMRNGVTGKSFLEIFPGILSRFGCKLSGTYNFNKTLPGIWYAEPKYDGMRAYVHVTEEEIKSYSRTGKPVPGLDMRVDIKAALLGIVRSTTPSLLDGSGIVFDGELLSTNRQLSIGGARSKSSANDLVYIIWDVFSADDWQVKGRSTTGPLPLPSPLPGDAAHDPRQFHTRRDWLQSVIGVFLSENRPKNWIVQVVPSLGTLLDPTPQIIREAMMDAIEQGYEGLMLKRRDHLHTFGRSDDWLKCKALRTAEFRLIDVLEGDGRLEGTCGRIVVDVAGVKVRVGTKMNDEDRAYFWGNKEKLLSEKTMIEVGFQGYTPDGSLDFPRYMRIRGHE